MLDVGRALMQHQNFIAAKSLLNDATSMLRICAGFATMRWFDRKHCNNGDCEASGGGIFEHSASQGSQC